MEVRWVIGRERPQSERAKSILAHAGAGLGYYVLNPDRSKVDDVIYSFLRAEDSPLGDGLDYATDVQIHKLEKMFNKRFSSRD